MIDLRSDTVTKPTAGMLDAMMSAEVGDDVFDSDPTVNALQYKVAELFRKEAALFCPSGTMTNQIALRVNTQPQDEVICDRQAHIHLYEAGGMAYNSMLTPKLLEGNRGRLSAEMIAKNINPNDIHFPRTRLVGLENTMNKGGGAVYDFSEIERIRQVCNQYHLKLHLDGARFFNAMVETSEHPNQHGALFDTLSICFSKGLGAPVGSVLLGSTESINQAKRIRKVFGGGMRQAGYLAAACIYALDHHVDRLKDDHDRARTLGDALEKLSIVTSVMPVETNIVIAHLDVEPGSFLEKLAENHVYAVPFGPRSVRFVTHLDFTDDHLDDLLHLLPKLTFQ